jgi:hypothetical protein
MSAFHPGAPEVDWPDATHCRHSKVERKEGMDGVLASPLPTFFIHSLSYDLAALIVVLDVQQLQKIEVRFDSPRAFRSFSESDYSHYLGDYKGETLLSSSDTGCGIWLSDTASYLLDYRQHVRPSDPETTFSCLIVSPQECVEVVCFEEPSIRVL